MVAIRGATGNALWGAIALAALSLAGIGVVRAQGADVGLINQVAGDVSYASSSGAGKVQAFMKVRSGDRFTLPAVTQLKVVYFQNGRQETWRGPAGLKSGPEQSEPLAGAAYEVVTLPVGVAQKIQKIPNLIQMAKMGGMQVREVAKLGGIQVRGAAAKPRPSPEQQADVAAARTTYAQLRKQAAQDDITPEFYLFTVLQEYLLYDEMKAAADEMLRRQPGNVEAQQLAEWAGERSQPSR